MAGCLAARTANHRSHEPPPSFAWGDPLHAIAPVRTLFIRGWVSTRVSRAACPEAAPSPPTAEQA
eukprot:scaffold106797_cov29-Phaeocystis_antarctica.AAC.1